MAEKLLTDRELKRARAEPRPTEYLLSDGGSLYARVRPTRNGALASIAWQFFFKWEGATERLSIGPYPLIGLAAARRMRDEARALLKGSPPRHPVHEARRVASEAAAKAHAQALERDVRALFEDWERVYLAGHRKDQGAEARAMFRLDVFPLLGARPARSIVSADIAFVLDRIVARGARRKANMVLSLLKQLFSWAMVRGAVDRDPTYGFRKEHAGGKERTRERTLSAAELAELAAKLPASGLSELHQAALRLLLATGARVGELERARWVNLNLEARTWRIPAADAKNGREHLVHLSDFALREARTLALFRQNDWLLASRRGDGPIAPKAIAKAVRDRQRTRQLRGRTVSAVGTLLLAGGEWTPHDLRRTFRTGLAALGVAPHVAERCLNHTLEGVLAVYDRHDYAAERAQALHAWGAQIDQIFTAAAPAKNIVDLVPAIKARRRMAVRAG